MSRIIPGDGKNSTLESVDRISALPDSILGVILSLIPTKNALATSALSKRWEFLWRTVHNLDFSLAVRRRGHMKEHFEAENKKFVGYVNHVLAHHDAGVVNKFHLAWTPSCIQSHATSWIKTALTRNVHELSLTLRSRAAPFGFMPITIFSCDSLRSMQLDGRIFLSAPSVFCLPRLESLHLSRVTFQTDEAFEKMIKGCPVLNHLYICMNDADNNFRFVISSNSLRCLELHLGLYNFVQLEASSLEHLRLYCVYISVNFVQVQSKLTSLVEADFRLYLDDDDFSEVGICNSVVDVVRALDHAKILTLSDDVIRALGCGTRRLSTNFNRLVKLKTLIKCCHWSSIQDFIQRSNNLEALTIIKYRTYLCVAYNHDHLERTTPVEVPRCLSTNLKKFVLEGYYGHDDEREMIRSILKHGSVLEVMEISCHRNKRREIELVQEIHDFPRKSPDCEVKFIRVDSKEQGQGAVTTMP